ncbi:MAG TPA: ABC transporter permease subunit, partial [Solirubrobacteraceae bacterium]|nr:ABC transporter permease subunit [Solirubrobacteraceae bacterium]
MIGRRQAGLYLLELIVPIGLVFLWWLVSRHSADPYFPPLGKSWAEFKRVYIWDHFNDDVLYSLRHFAIGTVAGIVVGFLIGLAMGLSPRLRRNLAPLTEFFRATPTVALIPIFLIMFGPGMTLEAGLIGLGCNWAVMLNTADGLRGVDPVMIETARSYGLTR